MLRSSRRRNVCTLLIELGEQLDQHKLKRQLTADPSYRWITSLRLRIKHPFALNLWRCDESAEPPGIALINNVDNKQTPLNWVAPSIDPTKESPVRISLVQQPKKHSILVASWHHCLMDARGAELFFQGLGAPRKPAQSIWIQDPADYNRQPLLKSLLLARETKKNLFDISRPPLLSLYQRTKWRPNLALRVMHFTEQETTQIVETAKCHGAAFMLSAFYLATTAKAVATILAARGQTEGDILVPVPQDRRKRGASGPVIGNQVTFLFYRIPNAKLLNLKCATTELIDQIKQSMRSHEPSNYLNMMDRLHHVPGIVYRWLMQRPTQGLMASFFYSDTGDSLNGFTTFLDKSIVSAVHYPPNIFPPGMTVIFTRFQGMLQVTFSYMHELVTDREINALMENLRIDLLGCSGTQTD